MDRAPTDAPGEQSGPNPAGNPDSALQRAVESVATSGVQQRLRRAVSVVKAWTDPPTSRTLDVEYTLTPQTDSALTSLSEGVRLSAAVSPQAPSDHGVRAPSDSGVRAPSDSGVRALRVPLDEPLPLIPVAIPKPWGRELWYTGIEARGESRVGVPGGELPLSDYLALAPQRLCGGTAVTLLKILDPRPQPVLGDLYFEVHEHKQEVYVITHIDPEAWPDGAGEIRFGMNQAARAGYASDDEFRHAYLNSVRRYESIRRRIDARRDSATTPTSKQEAQARQAMDDFTACRPLQVGDVVRVPVWVPHSLQHGVRVIEFQTPTYERHIISFAQRVLTQDHWDSREAIARMSLDAPEDPAPERLPNGAERIVDYDEFGAWRVSLNASTAFELPPHLPYALCMNISGSLQVGAVALAPEQACFIPGAALQRASLSTAASATCLIAAPGL